MELAEDERLPDELRLYERLYDDDLEPEREDPENELSKQMSFINILFVSSRKLSIIYSVVDYFNNLTYTQIFKIDKL